MKRGQVSIEFIVVFGFVFLMTIPLIAIFFDQSGFVRDAISSNQLRNVAIKIIDKSETVYYLGRPSRSTLKAQFPEHIEYFNITTRNIIIGYKNTRNNIQDIVVTSLVNLTGNITTEPGIHYIEIEASGDGVLIRDS